MTSSWSRVAEWVSSAATPNGTAVDMSPPQAPQASSVTVGRMRFPPAETRWRAAAWSVASASAVARVSSPSSAESSSKRRGTCASAAWALAGRAPCEAASSSCSRIDSSLGIDGAI